jgi:hypothetical protein
VNSILELDICSGDSYCGHQPNKEQYFIEIIIMLPLLLYVHTYISVVLVVLHYTTCCGVVGARTVGDCYSNVNCQCFVLQGATAAVGQLVLQTHTEPLLQERQPLRE